MSLAIATLVLAASATAQLTTSFVLPAGYDASEVGFSGSVVEVKNGKTTIALVYDDETNTDDIYFSEGPETITLQGSTWYESVTTTTEAFEEGDMTYSVGCNIPTRTRARPICTYSMGGQLAWNNYCSDYSSYTDAYTSTYEYTYSADQYGPASTETILETVDYQTYIPDFCTAGSTLPEEYAINTITMSRGDFSTYQVVITAGEELLGATAGSTPSGTAAQQTGSQGTQGTQGTPVTRSDGSTPTAAASAPEQNTGAAAMITAAPVLAGLGAAMAAFVL